MNYEEFNGFVREIFGEKEAFIILHDPRFVGNERKYLMDAMDSNYVSSVGEYVDRFERAFEKYTGAKHAIATNSGTAALHICLLLASVRPEEEVITQPLTFVATSNAIAYTGARPVYVDVDLRTMGLCPNKLESFLKENAKMGADGYAYNNRTGRRFGAVVPMHTFGHACDMDSILEVCNRYNIPLVEDAAESLGTLYKGNHTGLMGKLSAISFNGNKIVTTGGGGMILTDSDELADLAKHITTTAKVPHVWEYDHDITAYNYRLTNVAAALGLGQIEKCDFFVEEKRKLAEKYRDFFEGREGVEFYMEPEHSRSNYWLNAVILENREKRDEFLAFTNNNGVMTRPIWVLNNKLRMYRDCQADDVSNAQWLEDRVVNVPSTVIVEGYYERS